MTDQEISFFRSELSEFYKAVLEQFTRDYEETQKQMAPDRARNTRGKIAGALRGTGNAIAQTLFISSVSNNVSGDEFDFNPNRFKSRDRHLAGKMKILNFKKKTLRKLVKYYSTLQDMRREDQNIPKLADGLWITWDICDNRSHSDLIFAVMYVFKCGLCTRNKFARLACLDDLQQLPQLMHISSKGIQRYRLEFKARSYAVSVFEKYKEKFGKEYTVVQAGTD